MNVCPHTPNYPDLSTVPSLQEALSHCTIAEDDEKVKRQRALTSKDGGSTRLDSAYWSQLNDAQRAAVVAHERAHPAIGMNVDCEGCADKVGGYYMRAWGFAPSIVRESFAGLRVGRGQDQGHIADNAAEGAKAAERGLAARGLLGLPSAKLAARLRPPVTLHKATTKAVVKTPQLPAIPPQRPTTIVTTSAAADGSGSPLTPEASHVEIAATAVQVSPPSVSVSTEANVAVPAPASSAPVIGGTRGAGAGVGILPPVRDDGPSIALDPPIVGDSLPAPATPPPPPASDIAGDVVSTVLGESARPHAGKVLIAAGIAATLAVILVIVVRRASK